VENRRFSPKAARPIALAHSTRYTLAIVAKEETHDKTDYQPRPNADQARPSRRQPWIPFGGVKTSGFGREAGQEGLSEYMDPKTVSIGLEG